MVVWIITGIAALGVGIWWLASWCDAREDRRCENIDLRYESFLDENPTIREGKLYWLYFGTGARIRVSYHPAKHKAIFYSYVDKQMDIVQKEKENIDIEALRTYDFRNISFAIDPTFRTLWYFFWRYDKKDPKNPLYIFSDPLDDVLSIEFTEDSLPHKKGKTINWWGIRIKTKNVDEPIFDLHFQTLGLPMKDWETGIWQTFYQNDKALMEQFIAAYEAMKAE